MDSTKIIDVASFSIPQEAMEAFAWNQKLTKSNYIPPLQGEAQDNGLLSVFISADNKAILFFDDCAANGKTGRIINDEVTLHPVGQDIMMVQAKAYVYIDDVLKGSAVAAQAFHVTEIPVMDRVVQYASGIAKSRALTNAGYGVVSGVMVPMPNENPAPAPDYGSGPVHPSQIVPGFQMPSNGGFTGAANSVPAGQPMMAVPTGATMPGNGSNLNDSLVWAKNVVWGAKKKTMGELLNTSPRDIQWAAESLNQNSDVKRAALILYPDACRILGVAPKQLKT